MGFLTEPLSSDKAQGQTAHMIDFKEKESSLKIANGENELVTKKVGFSWIGSSCNFDLHVFEQNNWNFREEHLRIWEDGLVDRAAFSEQRLRQNFSSAKCTRPLVPHSSRPSSFYLPYHTDNAP